MSNTWSAILSAVLVVLAVLAEINLLRIFLSDWREGGRETRERRMSAHRSQQRTSPQHQAYRRTRSTRGQIAALVLTPAIVVTGAQAQEVPPEQPSTPGSTAAAPDQPEIAGRHLVKARRAHSASSSTSALPTRTSITAFSSKIMG